MALEMGVADLEIDEAPRAPAVMPAAKKLAPRAAWGGYYVFDMPKELFRRKSDMPLTVLIRTGSEVHRFAATLKWK